MYQIGLNVVKCVVYLKLIRRIWTRNQITSFPSQTGNIGKICSWVEEIRQSEGGGWLNVYKVR